MFKKLMAVASLAVVAGASSLVVPTAATARSPATDYAVAQCGNGGWEQKEYPSYQECYTFAIQYYFQQTGSGPGGGGGAGGGGDFFLTDIPDYKFDKDTWGCGGTRFECNNGS